MTTGRDIAFWENLNDEVLRFHFNHHLLSRIVSKDGLKHLAPTLPCYLLLLFVPLCFLTFSRLWSSFKEKHTHTRVALHALIAVVVPTCSLWPGRYIEYASVLSSQISIPLEVIIRDIIDGLVEFRNPINDLADLIGSGASVNGHTICIAVGWRWWLDFFKWWMVGESNSGFLSGASDWPHDMSPASSSPQSLSRPFVLSSSLSCPVFCLDYLSHDVIPSLNTGCKVTLEFTAFSPSVRLLSTARIISAIPFMISRHPRRQPRSIISVLKQLSASYGPNLVIDSLSNVSLDYEHAVHHMYKSFSWEQQVREKWVKAAGIKAWRWEMFLLALEAALVRRGWIERWAIQVTVK